MTHGELTGRGRRESQEIRQDVDLMDRPITVRVEPDSFDERKACTGRRMHRQTRNRR